MIPNDILLELFSYTRDWKDIVRWGGVCKTWRSAAYNPILWDIFKKSLIIFNVQAQSFVQREFHYTSTPRFLGKVIGNVMWVLYRDGHFIGWDLHRGNARYDFEIEPGCSFIKQKGKRILIVRKNRADLFSMKHQNVLSLEIDHFISKAVLWKKNIIYFSKVKGTIDFNFETRKSLTLSRDLQYPDTFKIRGDDLVIGRRGTYSVYNLATFAKRTFPAQIIASYEENQRARVISQKDEGLYLDEEKISWPTTMPHYPYLTFSGAVRYDKVSRSLYRFRVYSQEFIGEPHSAPMFMNYTYFFWYSLASKKTETMAFTPTLNHDSYNFVLNSKKIERYDDHFICFRMDLDFWQSGDHGVYSLAEGTLQKKISIPLTKEARLSGGVFVDFTLNKKSIRIVNLRAIPINNSYPAKPGNCALA